MTADRSGVVLAGGASTRMGADKALLPFEGVPLVRRAVDAVRPLAAEVLVLVGSAVPPGLREAAGPGARIVLDRSGGPLAALAEAGRVARGPRLLVAPCDTPRLATRHYERLLSAASGHDGAMFSVGRVVQPLVAVYEKGPLVQAARAALGAGDTAARALLPRMDLAIVEAREDARDLEDADTPEDLARLARSPEG